MDVGRVQTVFEKMTFQRGLIFRYVALYIHIIRFGHKITTYFFSWQIYIELLFNNLVATKMG
jgi:hypothetical protein